MILSITGPRPQRCGGYYIPNPTYISVCQQIENKLKDLNPEKVIVGMAQGIDQWTANICLKIQIPFLAAIPFIGQEKMWTEKSKKIYKILLDKAVETVIISEGEYTGAKMHARNEWMVNNSDELLAILPKETYNPGGTEKCVKFAESINKTIHKIFI